MHCVPKTTDPSPVALHTYRFGNCAYLSNVEKLDIRDSARANAANITSFEWWMERMDGSWAHTQSKDRDHVYHIRAVKFT